MNLKKVVGITLLVFAAGSVFFMIGREMNPCTSCDKVVPPFLGDVELDQKVSPVPEQLPVVLVSPLRIFYFHGQKRCATCHKLEDYAAELLQEHFADQLEKGTMTWEVINVETPENEHYIDDYKLVARGIVLSKNEEGKEVAWKNLDQVWQLVADKQAYQQYIRESIEAMKGS